MGKASLSADIGGLLLDNPVMNASGTFGYGAEFEELVDLSRLGAIVGKTVTAEPRAGNPPPRMVEAASGIINAIGLENPGIDAFIAEDLPRMKGYGVPVIVNIAGDSIEDYATLAHRLDGEGIAALEVNVSCPNVKSGLAFGTEPAALSELVRAVRAACSSCLVVKLTPNVADIAAVARAAAEAGADCLGLINTVAALAVDWRTRKPKIANVTGGLSGPAIKPIGLRMVRETANAVSIPIIGVGGVSNAEDVLEYVVAGATAVQVGSANFVNPLAMIEILDALPALLEEAGVTRIADLVGTLVA
jgi:dihydroorotate dehydrogenase (NAD+) catalytic subunit